MTIEKPIAAGDYVLLFGPREQPWGLHRVASVSASNFETDDRAICGANGRGTRGSVRITWRRPTAAELASHLEAKRVEEERKSRAKERRQGIESDPRFAIARRLVDIEPEWFVAHMPLEQMRLIEGWLDEAEAEAGSRPCDT